jgi:thioredoxin-like negative regulator of GroEL
VVVVFNLVLHYLALDRFGEARARVEELRGIAPADVIGEVDGKARFVMGQPGESLKIFQQMLAQGKNRARHTAALLAASNLAEMGRYREASGLLKSLLPEDAANDHPQWRALKLIALAELARLQGERAEVAGYAALAMSLEGGDAIQEQAGVLLARSGRLTEARRALDALRALPAIPRTQRRIDRLAGEIALERGDRAGLGMVRKAAAETTNWDLNDSLAYALERTGDNEAALAERIRLGNARAFLWGSAERALPGVWSTNVSALIALAARMGRSEDAGTWSRRLETLR